MRSKQHLNDHVRTRTASVPIRVFDDVAPTPWTPAPRRWNHPMTVTVLTTVCAPVLTTVPSLPPLTGLLCALLGFALAAGLEVSRWWWAKSRQNAAAEAAWVASQSDYRLGGPAEALRWTDEDQVRTALLEEHRGGWRLSLYDVHAPVLELGA